MNNTRDRANALLGLTTRSTPALREPALYRSRSACCLYLASGERRQLMILRAPVFISTVTARPGSSLRSLPSA